jgi:imidazolonepropionase-like amidohydrolase
MIGIGLMMYRCTLLAAGLLLYGTYASSAEPVWECDQRPLLVTNANIWTSSGPLTGREFLIEAGRITALGPAGSIARERAPRLLDVKRRLVVPGLIDSHVHFGLPGPTPSDFSAAYRTTTLRITPRQTLRSGVTTARVHLWNLSDGPWLKAQANDDCYPAPRLQLGGPGLAGGVPNLDGRNFSGVASIDDARHKVRQARAAGADWLAVHDLDKFSPGELAAIVKTAREEGLRLMAQGYRYTEYDLALKHNFQSIEYLALDEMEPFPSSVLTQLRERGDSIALSPPIGHYHRQAAHRADPELINRARHYEFMPTEAAEFLRSRIPRSDVTKEIERLPIMSERFRTLLGAHIPMVIGSDSGSPGNFHSDAIWWELSTWISLGADASEAIAAATSRPAALLALPDVGALSIGMRGDFVVLDTDASKPSLRYENVHTVAKGGVLYVDRASWVGPND